MLVGDALRIRSQACDRQADSQRFLILVKLSVGFLLVDNVFEIQIEIVEAFNSEDERCLIYI